MDTFFIEENLTITSRQGKEPEYLHRITGFRGQFCPLVISQVFSTITQDNHETWISVIGSPDGSASAVPNIALQLPPWSGVS